jgi:hypothetical protein
MTATMPSMAGLLHQWFYKRVQQHVGYAQVPEEATSLLRKMTQRAPPRPSWGWHIVRVKV